MSDEGWIKEKRELIKAVQRERDRAQAIIHAAARGVPLRWDLFIINKGSPDIQAIARENEMCKPYVEGGRGVMWGQKHQHKWEEKERIHTGPCSSPKIGGSGWTQDGLERLLFGITSIILKCSDCGGIKVVEVKGGKL